MKRAVGYVRVSSMEQVQGLSLPVQEQAVVDWCRAQDIELVRSFSDPAVSGTLPLHERPGLAAALDAVKEHEQGPVPITVLVVARWDRLARDTLVSLLVEQEFGRHGCQVMSADGLGVDQTTREIFAVMASAERRNLVARMRGGRQAKAARGGYAGGQPMLGYKAVSGELVVDTEAAVVIGAIFMAAQRGGACAGSPGT